MSVASLIVLLGGREIGQVRQDRNGRLAFIYEEGWRHLESAYPLSLSMPLAAPEHKHRPIDAFLWGLLPDSAPILDLWARRFQVSARNPFALIAQVGEDCAGAAQFVRPERIDELRADARARVEWLTEEQVADRLRALRADHSAWRQPNDTGQFSLAGAQPKTALLLENGRWGVPSGRIPTTHILKPPTGSFDGHIENEHFCLALARELGIPAANSEVRRFGKETAIVVERYDRASTSALSDEAAASSSPQAANLRKLAKTQPVLRLHQEDLCQAFGILPTSKYQNEGGPTPAQVVDLLRTYSSKPTEDMATFIDALAFNWLIGGTDAHAKNYSLLHAPGGRVRLAPLYDVASSLPYFDPDRIKLAMKIGRTYKLREIGRGDWELFAKQVRQPVNWTLDRVADLSSRMVSAVAPVRGDVQRDGIRHPIIGRLAKTLATRAKACLVSLRS